MSAFPINQEALAHYRKVRDFNEKYSAIDERTHAEHYNDDASWVSTSTGSVTSGSVDLSLDSLTLSPVRSRGARPRLTKFHSERITTTNKAKTSICIDRSLRNQEWLGSPVSVGKARRSWRPKNPEDMAFLKMKSDDA